ncbi:hypothetical protein ACP4OV_014037 [Aristida adscensionis]
MAAESMEMETETEVSLFPFTFENKGMDQMKVEMQIQMQGGPSSAVLPGGDALSQSQNFQWLMRRCDRVPSCSSSINISGTSTSTLSTTYTSSRSSQCGTLSTSYTPTRGSHLHHFSNEVLQAECDLDPDPLNVRGMVFQFHGGDASAVDRWLSEVDAGWVLRITDDASQGMLFRQPLGHIARSWSTALTRTVKSILQAVTAYDDASSTGKEEESFGDFYLLCARFLEATILKMLPFVSVIGSLGTADTGVSDDKWEELIVDKLQALAQLADPIENAKDAAAILRSHWSPNPDTRAFDKAVDILEQAIFHTFGEIKIGIMSGCGATNKIQQRSPDVERITRSIVKCINLLVRNHYWLSIIELKVCNVGKCQPRNEKTSPASSLIMDIVHCLEEKLAEKSQSFADDGKRFLFLLNNTYYIRSLLHFDDVPFLIRNLWTELSKKINDYIQKYLQVSWEPVLSCLHNSASKLWLSLGRPTPLLKFESEFKKTYTAQKLWKVPDPDLRRKLRNAIIGKVISGFTKYLEDNNINFSGLTKCFEDNNITTPRITPQELEEMLQELFEG